MDKPKKNQTSEKGNLEVVKKGELSNVKCALCNQEMQEIITSIPSRWGEYELQINGVKAYNVITVIN